jgi:uncharacterized protein YijF (DUF1287 family)
MRHSVGTLVFVSIAVALLTAQRSGDELVRGLVDAAVERTSHDVTYDGSYRGIEYPGGDVPDSIGVCTDFVVRVYRAVGIDLQVVVHEDMTANFSEYPNLWGHTGTDRNIDHRRVPNLRVFFERHGESLTVSRHGSDYQAGDLVTWLLREHVPHIGIVTDRPSADGRRPLIAHNIGRGPELEDMMFDYEITGWYRYPPRD